MTSPDDVRDLVFSEDRTHRGGSIFKSWIMNVEFDLFTDKIKQDYWREGKMYEIYQEETRYNALTEQMCVSPNVFMYLSHNVAKVFNHDKQFVCYVILEKEEAANADSQPKPMYYVYSDNDLYKRFSLSQGEFYTFNFNDKEYNVDLNGSVKEVQAKKSIEVIQVKESVSVEREEKTLVVLHHYVGFLEETKGSSSSSSSSSELDDYSPKRYSPKSLAR